MMNGNLLELLLLILVANGTPVLVSYLFSHRDSLAIDFGKQLPDHHPLFGKNKTWRGLFFSLVVTALIAWIIGVRPDTGVLIALLAMSGDLLSSFIKRRLGKTAGSQFILLDQLPESLLPALLLYQRFDIDLMQVMIVVVLFVIFELILSYYLYKIGVRKHPY